MVSAYPKANMKSLSYLAWKGSATMTDDEAYYMWLSIFGPVSLPNILVVDNRELYVQLRPSAIYVQVLKIYGGREGHCRRGLQ